MVLTVDPLSGDGGRAGESATAAGRRRRRLSKEGHHMRCGEEGERKLGKRMRKAQEVVKSWNGGLED